MCPLRVTALAAAGVTSAGGLTALVVRSFGPKRLRSGSIRPAKEPRMDRPRIVSRDEWLAARKQHLAREKELTRLRDRVSAERRNLPCVKVDKPYVFEGPDGKESLADLFGGRNQLIVYHFMFGPEWKEGCPSCSFVADHIDGALPHLAARDVTLVVVSRAPSTQLRPSQHDEDGLASTMAWLRHHDRYGEGSAVIPSRS
jgi:predicted dithiol-disulfide oxidoreductase (DUF899 family)